MNHLHPHTYQPAGTDTHTTPPPGGSSARHPTRDDVIAELRALLRARDATIAAQDRELRRLRVPAVAPVGRYVDFIGRK
jgi:hypothetical protein